MSTERVPPTLAAWSSAGLHVCQLESGAWIKFRYPDLSMLAAAGKVPEHLKAIALTRVAKKLKLLIEPAPDTDEEPTLDGEKLALSHQLDNWLVTRMVAKVPAADPQFDPPRVLLDENGVPTEWVKVELDVDDVDEHVPHEDKTMLIELAERLRDTDARGVVMGVTPLSRFARFRDAHGCGPDCEACERIRGEGLSRLLPSRVGTV